MTRLFADRVLPPELRGAILALGNFDGFHLGHQAVVGEALRWAQEEGRAGIVATFDPHPVRHFAPDAPPFRLTTLDQREELFTAAGADAMLVFRFDEALASTTAEDFVCTLLAGRLGAAGVVTGEDFTFGKGRAGNRQVLERLGAGCGIPARAVGAVIAEGAPVSSSRIREALKAGNCDAAARLLTRPFAIRGRVEHGDKRGRTIGYPTANVALGPYLRPRYGIYAVTARVLDGESRGRVLTGAASVGVRPTFVPAKELLEVHLFDFSGELYGQEIEVAFRAFLRPEARFASIAELVTQMARDCDEARERLSAAP